MTPEATRDYAHRVLVLQGGGALGSYQAGVFEGLVDAGIEANWVAGISIGALNAAVIAGNPPERRVDRLREFWEGISRQPFSTSLPDGLFAVDPSRLPNALRAWMSMLEANRAVFEGQAGFFNPRRGFLALWPGADPSGAASYYDTKPLAATLERLVDFDRINHPGSMRVSVGAVQVSSGDMVYFDNRERLLDVRHFMASAAIPPSFPAVEIDGEHYWDGGIVMNTPLLYVLESAPGSMPASSAPREESSQAAKPHSPDSQPRNDTLVFQVDLWSAKGRLPTSLPEVEERRKDIIYSSRTRTVNHYMRDQQSLHKCIADVLALVPPDQRDQPAARRAEALACDRRCNVQQLICADTSYEGSAKDYEFGLATMRRRWQAGLGDLQRLLADPSRLAMPGPDHPFVVHTAPPSATIASEGGRASLPLPLAEEGRAEGVGMPQPPCFS